MTLLKSLFVASFFVAGVSFAGYAPISTALVVDAKTGEVIYSSNPDQKTQPASLTKMMTLLLTFKAIQQKKIYPTTMIKISANAASQQPCSLGLRAGEVISVRNAILSLVTRSANDIAVALAEHIGGTEKNFVALMNKEAKRLGMSSTVFCNPSGWKNPQQLSTGRDMAKLARALLNEYPGYYHFFSTKQFCFNNKCIKTHNRLLGKRGSFIVDGIKTGFLNASGFNLAASARRGNKRLIAVVLGGRTGKERDDRANMLLKKGFSKLLSKEILAKYAKNKLNKRSSNGQNNTNPVR